MLRHVMRLRSGALIASIALAAGLGLPGPASAVTALQVNEAELKGNRAEGIDPAVLRAQVLLDRLRFSPGSIDGRNGDNFANALDAFASANNLKPTGHLTPEIFKALVATYEGPVLVPYTISEADVKGPFLKTIPKDYLEMAELDSLGYTSPQEGLAEKFHLSRALLEALNPGAKFDTAGEPIVVAASRPDPGPGGRQRAGSTGAGEKARATRLEVDKPARVLRAFDAQNGLLAVYPASIGSEDKPAPSGTFEVRAVAVNPTYTYNPEYGFKGQKATKKVEVPGGPNNPVGAVWIDLSADSYGIHGTPEPERIGKTASHGCVRLTNWDVRDLATLVHKGTVVEFKE